MAADLLKQLANAEQCSGNRSRFNEALSENSSGRPNKALWRSHNTQTRSAQS